jgi:hypothetical protein
MAPARNQIGLRLRRTKFVRSSSSWQPHRVLLFHFPQILAHGVMDLGCFPRLFAWDAALLGRNGLHAAAIHRPMLALHQSHVHTPAHDLFEQLLEQLRLLKPPLPVLGERRVMWDLLIESQTREPAPRQVHPLLRILLIGSLYGITSERKLLEELAHPVLISDE